MNAKISSVVSKSTGRRAGVLLHVTSLPGPYGIGDFGPQAAAWINLLASSGQRWWQMLPLGPAGEGNSPYRCFSAFAGNPLLISPDLLLADGLLARSDLRGMTLPGGSVNFPRVTHNKLKLLRSAFDHFKAKPPRDLTAARAKFESDHSAWLEDYALFMAIRKSDPAESWTRWPTAIVRRDPHTLKETRDRLAAAIDFEKFVQFLFFRQLASLRNHAESAGVSLIGDLPIFVSPESAEVWTHPRLFQLDRYMRPRAVAGVPPDLFSSTGQNWGNPLYDWTEMAKDRFAWWKRRIQAALNQADLVRIDHFRGFEAYWRIPASAATAQTGRWIKAPGMEFFAELLRQNSQLPLLAEDLGIITPEVEALRDRFCLPGMRVLQFGFGEDPGNPHLPHNFVRHCFAYTGTHDNDTAVSWYRALSGGDRRRLHAYAPDLQWETDPGWPMIRMLYSSIANDVIVPVQDLLGLDHTARMNTPGEKSGNWEWRLESLAICKKPLNQLAELARIYERNAPLVRGTPPGRSKIKAKRR